MRPKLLEIEGLQSFKEKQRIDFEKLGETGLFGIFGPTGSGKSTVLDAITLALYGRVKRAERGTQGIINTGMDTAFVSFTFELLKENQRRTYRVDRSFQRKKGTENSCEPKVVRLVEMTETGEIPISDRTTDVTRSVEALLGLNHDDFTRAVVLPQNSFQEFLLLENSKKREMLERIFYLEEYGKGLLDKLSRKIFGIKSRMDVLSGKLSEFADATDEALQLSEKEMKAAETERKRIEKEFRLLDARHSESREVWQLVRELAQAEQSEAQHAVKKDEMAQAARTLDKAARADSLAGDIRKTSELEDKLAKTCKELEGILQAVPTLEQALEQTRQQNDRLNAEFAVEQPRLISLKTRLTDALSIQGQISVISGKLQELRIKKEKLISEIARRNDEYIREKEAFEKLEQTAGLLQKELASYQIKPEYREKIQHGVKLENEVDIRKASCAEIENKITTLTATITDLESKLTQSRAAIAEQQRVLDDLTAGKQAHETSMPEDRNSLEAYKDQMNRIKGIAEVLKIRKAELEQEQQKVISLESNCERLEGKINKLHGLREEQERAYAQNKTELEKTVRELEKNTAYMLSRNLTEGEPCPVCGSCHHPSPAVHASENSMSSLESEMENARKRLEESESALRETDNNLLVTGEQLKACLLQKEQAIQERKEKLEQFSREQDKLPEAYRNLEPEQLQLETEKMNTLLLEKQKAFEAWEKKRDEFQTGIQKALDGLAEQKPDENKMSAALDVNRDNLNQLRVSFDAATAELQAKQKVYSLFIESMNIPGAAAEMDRLAENDKKAGSLQKELEQTQALSEKKRTVMEQLKETLQKLKEEAVRIQAEMDNLKAQKTEKESGINELAGSIGINEQLKQVDIKLSDYERDIRERREMLVKLEKQYSDMHSKRTILENQKRIYTDSLEQEERVLSAAISEKGFSSREEVMLSIIPADKQKTMKEEIAAYEQKAINIRAEKDIALKKLKGRTITEEEWNALDCRYQEMTAYREACVTHSEMAKSMFAQISSKHERWLELSRSYSELAGKHDLYQQIQKLLKAEKNKDNSFIDYIAEERLRYVAAKASEILGVMTKYKYALELDTNSGFIICDNANGGVHRMVTSLSGGETFLTALSLALALSEQIQLKGQSPLEFFFLDEGFGTLDSSLLDSVMDSLERLSNRERVIGIISHVPELRNRIARRLMINPPTPQGDGSRASIEKA